MFPRQNKSSCMLEVVIAELSLSRSSAMLVASCCSPNSTSASYMWRTVQLARASPHRRDSVQCIWYTSRMLCDRQRGQCVLHVASSYGYPQMVKSLLQFKANADCRDEVRSSLCIHCIVEMLSKSCSSIDDVHASVGPLCLVTAAASALQC